MTRIFLLVVALLPLIILGNAAAAAGRDPEHKSKNARKILVLLANAGINSPNIVKFIDYVDGNMEDGHLRLAQKRMMGGKLTLRYKLDASPNIKELELRFTPEDSHFVGTATTRGVMVNYQYKF